MKTTNHYKAVAFVLLFLFSTDISAQTFQETYEQFKQQAHAKYENFRQQANKEYAEWMKQAWEWHKKIEPMPRPKDDMLPPVIYDKEKEKPKEEPRPVPHDDVVPVPVPEPQPKPIAPIREENEGEYTTASFTFFGTPGSVRLPKGFALRLKGNDENAVVEAWEELSSNRYDNLIRDCLVLRMEHQLCDWAYLMMLGTMSEAVCGKGSNEASLLQGYVLCQSGYKIRFGMTESKKLRLLFKSEHRIFDLVRYELNDGMFYTTESGNDDNGLYISDISYPGEKPLSLWITQEQMFAQRKSAERELTSNNGIISVMSQVNENLLHFYDTYPASNFGDNVVTQWAMYANAPLSENVKARLYPQLKEALKPVNSVEDAAGWLLNWMQTAFVYEYDDKVWGRDRAFFAEESLYYPYCDCEDRSILYSRLVRDLLGLDVILVFYPGHLATAVCFNAPVNGDYIDLNGKRFTICDPTYIGAPIGDTMTGMDNKTAKVILLSK